MNRFVRYLTVGCLILHQLACAQLVRSGQPTVPNARKMIRDQHKMGVSAHRGAAGSAPENTLATYQVALQMGVDYLEIDVRTTRDGKLVILHDGTLNRTTSGSGPVSDKTLDELKKLSAANGFGDSFLAERIPTLEEVAQLLTDWNAHHTPKTNLYVDCKNVAPEPLVNVLMRYDLLKDAVFYGSDDYLLALRNVAPSAKLMPSLKSADALADKINRLHPYAFDVSWSALTDSLVRQIHRQEIRVFTDLLDEYDTPDHYVKAAALGVDIIQTDHVSTVYQTLTAQGRN